MNKKIIIILGVIGFIGLVAVTAINFQHIKSTLGLERNPYVSEPDAKIRIHGLPRDSDGTPVN